MKIKNILASNFARNSPGHLLIPNPNVPKLLKDLFFPDGVLKYGDVGSHLSGINLSGDCHSFLLFASPGKFKFTQVPFSMFTPFISTFALASTGNILGAGSSNLIASLKKYVRYEISSIFSLVISSWDFMTF